MTFLYRFPFCQIESTKLYWRCIKLKLFLQQQFFLLQSIEAIENTNILFFVKLD